MSGDGNSGEQRTRGKPFAKGRSGNPKGRPVVKKEVQALAREYTDAAMQTLVAMLKTKSPAVRVKAAEALLDRGWGRPGVSVALTGANGGPVQVEHDHGIDLSRLSPQEFDDLGRILALAAKSDDARADLAPMADGSGSTQH